MNDIDSELVKAIQDEFNRWVDEGAVRGEFTLAKLLSNVNSSLRDKHESKLAKKSGYWAAVLAEAGINPDIFVSTKAKSTRENEERLKTAIQELSHKVGLQALNDRSMNKTNEYVELPDSLKRYRGRFRLSDSRGVLPEISLAALQRRCFKAFGTWDAALSASGINPKDVKRRTAMHSPIDLLRQFDSFNTEQKGLWTVATMREEDSSLFKAIGNSSRYNSVKFPYSQISSEYIFAMWVYWKSWKETGSIKFEEDWWIQNEASLLDEYETSHRAQERWSLEKVQHETLRLFGDGSNLNRDDLAARGAGKLLSTARRFSKSGGEAEVFEKAGILLAETKALEIIIKDKTLKDVANGLRALVKKSLDEERNFLSREAMQAENSELFNAALRWFNRFNNTNKTQNDWSKALKFFGLNPAVFELAATKRVKRGIAFQRFFEGLLRPHFEFMLSPESVVGDRQVSANKSYSRESCHHDTRCRPDFVFHNMIIDTKVGGALAKPAQLKRYLDHKEHVIVITLNDNDKLLKFGDREVSVISFRSFCANSGDILGVEFPSDSEQNLTEILRIASLYSPAT